MSLGYEIIFLTASAPPPPPPPPPTHQSYSTTRESLLKGQEQYVAYGEHQVTSFGQLTLYEVWNALFITWCHHAYIYVGDMKQQGFWRALLRVARGIPGATLASWVLLKLPKCFISRSMRIGACNSQLFWYIFNPVFTVVKKEIPSVRSYTRFRSYTRVVCEHDCYMKHACTCEFNFTNLLAIL